MKFLTICTLKDVFFTLPQAERQKLVVSQHEYNLEFKKKMGDKLQLYTVSGWNDRYVVISELNSIEELSQLFREAPVVSAGFYKYESYPLVEHDEK